MIQMNPQMVGYAQGLRIKTREKSYSFQKFEYKLITFHAKIISNYHNLIISKSSKRFPNFYKRSQILFGFLIISKFIQNNLTWMNNFFNAK